MNDQTLSSWLLIVGALVIGWIYFTKRQQEAKREGAGVGGPALPFDPARGTQPRSKGGEAPFLPPVDRGILEEIMRAYPRSFPRRTSTTPPFVPWDDEGMLSWEVG